MADGYDLVTGTDARGEQTEVKSMIATVHADGVFDSHKISKISLEIAQLLAKNEVTSGESIRDSSINFTLEPAVVLSRINEWHPIIQIDSPSRV